MSSEQVTVFALLGLVLAGLLWGRVRYDVAAFSALVLVVSRGLSSSGAIELLAQRLAGRTRPLEGHVSIMAGAAAGLPALMNNVAALALLMPIDV